MDMRGCQNIMKIVTIHQPNYLPWLGFFHKMVKSDVFVFLDNVPFTKNSVQNRCTIRSTNGEFFLTVPVITKDRLGQLTKDVEIDRNSNWQRKHWQSILQSYQKSRYFHLYKTFFEDVYHKIWNELVPLNEELIRYIAKHLNIETTFVRASELDISGKSTELLLSICKVLNADVYLSGPSGREYLDEYRFQENNIEVKYDQFNHPIYEQQYQKFIPKLSIIDLLFNHGPESLGILSSS
ncbi:MAG: hypothetical protein QG588_1992 [Candidatus Poribacteria bacterium]|nr:hypothetical protein [Candidatus Poribacteria bacterium]